MNLLNKILIPCSVILSLSIPSFAVAQETGSSCVRTATINSVNSSRIPSRVKPAVRVQAVRLMNEVASGNRSIASVSRSVYQNAYRLTRNDGWSRQITREVMREVSSVISQCAGNG